MSSFTYSCKNLSALWQRKAQGALAVQQDTLDELCAEGAVELCERISSRQYDAERGKLTTFLQPFLLGRMHRYLSKKLGAMSLPKDEMQRIKQAQRLHFEEGRAPNEVARSLGVSAEKAAQLIGCKTTPLPLSEIACEDTDDDPLPGCCLTSIPLRRSRPFTGRFARKNWSSFSTNSAPKNARFLVIPTGCLAMKSCLRMNWDCGKCCPGMA